MFRVSKVLILASVLAIAPALADVSSQELRALAKKCSQIASYKEMIERLDGNQEGGDGMRFNVESNDAAFYLHVLPDAQLMQALREFAVRQLNSMADDGISNIKALKIKAAARRGASARN